MIYLASLTEEIGDKVEGYYILKTKEDLYKVVANNKESHKVIIRRDFAKEYFTPTGLQEFIHNVETVNRNLIVEIDGDSLVLTEKRFVDKLNDIRNIQELFSIISYYPKESMEIIKDLAGKEKSRSHELLEASNRVSNLHTIIDNLQFEKENLEHQLHIEQDNKFNAQSKLNTLIRRINYQYDKDIDKDKIFNVNINNYDRVIYVKEITRVQYVDSLIYYLKEILKVLYGMPVRFVCIEGYYASGKLRLYPDLVPHYKMKERDVLSSDILMLGMQPNLMEDILKNPNNVSVLIVLDRGGYAMPHILGNNVEYFYTVSDIKDVPESIPRTRIISYNEDTLYIPLVENFGSLDESERMTTYSSMDIVKKIVSLLERR